MENGGGSSESLRDPLYLALHNHESNGEIALLVLGAEEMV